MAQKLLGPVVASLILVFGLGDVRARDDDFVVGDRCELTKPLKVSAKPRGRGKKTKLVKGTVVKVLEIDKRWLLVMAQAAASGSVEAPPEGFVKLTQLDKRCQRLASPAEPATPAGSGAAAAPGATPGVSAADDLTFGGASGIPSNPTTPEAPEGTHECVKTSFEECTAQCDLGNAVSCYTSAEQHRARRAGGAEDEAAFRKVVGLYTRACNRGHSVGCVRLGEMYQRGEGVPVDDRVVRGLYEKACGMASGLGCTNLGYIFFAGQGVPPDPKRAAAFYGQGCMNGSPQGCVGLGSLYQNGQGLPADPAKAADLFRRGCDGDPKLGAKGCSNLGYLYEAGQGVARDRDQAITFYRRGCSGGEAYACQRLEAHGVPKPDPVVAPAPTPPPEAAPAPAAPPVESPSPPSRAEPTPPAQ